MRLPVFALPSVTIELVEASGRARALYDRTIADLERSVALAVLPGPVRVVPTSEADRVSFAFALNARPLLKATRRALLGVSVLDGPAVRVVRGDRSRRRRRARA